MLGLSPGSRFATDLQICQHNLKSGNLQCMLVEDFGVKGGQTKRNKAWKRENRDWGTIFYFPQLLVGFVPKNIEVLGTVG